MPEPTNSPLPTVAAGLPLLPAGTVENAGIRISQLDAWNAVPSGPTGFCFCFCLAVPSDDAVRAA
jgi:hypothetical protein